MKWILTIFMLALVSAQKELEELPVSLGTSAGCEITMSSVLVLNCPDKHIVYSTQNFIKYGNRGVQNYGKNYRLISVQKTVQASGNGYVSVLNPLQNTLVRYIDTGADIGGIEVIPFTLFYY